jgi:hypothetical protein
VHIAESDNLRQTVNTLKNAENTSTVVLGCADGYRRTVILNELVEEYEYDDAVEPIQIEGKESKLEAIAS